MSIEDSWKELFKFYKGPSRVPTDKNYWFLGGTYQDSYALCSDNNCPCPQVRIPHGEGFIYVVDNGNGSVSANITCEQGARLRKLDLKVAHEDAKHWWATGMVPFRPTPLKEGHQDSPYKSRLSDTDQAQIRAKEFEEQKKRLAYLAGLNNVKYLFVDTETTGFPKNWHAPITDTQNWPRIVQIAWIEYDGSGNEISSFDSIIRPVGFSIPDNSTRIHKITTDKAVREGKELKEVLETLNKKIKAAEYIVAHNMEFDEKIILSELYRLNLPLNPLKEVDKICTMRLSTNLCAIPSGYGDFKFPSLTELYRKLFNQQLRESHNASVDIKAAAKCFWELKKNKIIMQ